MISVFQTNFEYLLGRFTEPAELFGPVDLRKLREGTVETDSTGMLPEANIAFLDEVFLGSTAILNTLLGILNERRFRRGHTNLLCPLKVCVGAANALPEDESLQAFGDRFLLHTFVEPVADHHLEDMLTGDWQLETHPLTPQLPISTLDVLSQAAKQVDLRAAQVVLAQAVRLLRQHQLHLSDRRIVRTQRLIAAATVLSGRMVATEADVWPLLYVIPTQATQLRAQAVLRELLHLSNNPTLRFAVETAVAQPMSRVDRLKEAAKHALEQPDATAIEQVLRDLDANFMTEQLPEDLKDLRQQLIAMMAQT